MKRKFKQWWSTIPPILTKRTITYHLNSLNTKKKPTTYDFGKPGPDSGHEQQSGGTKPANGLVSFKSKIALQNAIDVLEVFITK